MVRLLRSSDASAPRTAKADAGAAPASLAACETASPGAWPPVSFLAPRVFELRVAAMAPGPPVGSEIMGSRCVALDLDFVQDFHGHGAEKASERLHVVVQQSLATLSTARPAGTWWVGEQSLEPGAELLAFCIDGAATATLLASCHVLPAGDLRADLALARDAEQGHVSAVELAGRIRKQCASTSFLLVDYLWTKHAEEARRDPRVFGAIVSLLEERACPVVAKSALLGALVGGLGEATGSAPHVRRLAIAMFRMLDMPELHPLHDNVVDPYLMVLLGLQSGAPPLTATRLFGADPAARRAATASLDAYRGRADVAKLRAWLAAP